MLIVNLADLARQINTKKYHTTHDRKGLETYELSVKKVIHWGDLNWNTAREIMFRKYFQFQIQFQFDGAFDLASQIVK